MFRNRWLWGKNRKLPTTGKQRGLFCVRTSALGETSRIIKAQLESLIAYLKNKGHCGPCATTRTQFHLNEINNENKIKDNSDLNAAVKISSVETEKRNSSDKNHSAPALDPKRCVTAQTTLLSPTTKNFGRHWHSNTRHHFADFWWRVTRSAATDNSRTRLTAALLQHRD